MLRAVLILVLELHLDVFAEHDVLVHAFVLVVLLPRLFSGHNIIMEN